MTKLSIPKGMRDFSPTEMLRRNHIFDTIKDVYRLYGYSQIETPAMEELSVLMGKYGEEGDRLLFRILNSGDFLSGLSTEECLNISKVTGKICEKGLRYDLTVPFARYVVMHRNELTFPFKRFQIQPVWRADRPQRGRYREFFQCDADVIGSDSLFNEVELIQILDEVFSRLRIRVSIKLNNRKILAGIAEVIGEADKLVDITVAIDKFDKIGFDGVNKELSERGVSGEAISKLQPILQLTGTNDDKLKAVGQILASSSTGLQGVEEMSFICSKINMLSLKNEVVLDLALARGLNYYTGAIFEVKALDATIGSIAGGGRYDNLTGIFGLPGVSGVGISFGADRIYDVMQQLDLFPENSMQATQIMFVNFGDQETNYILPIINKLRLNGICCELYPDAVKIKKQMAYAAKNRIHYVAIAGVDEIREDNITLKDMMSGNQQSVATDELIKIVKK